MKNSMKHRHFRHAFTKEAIKKQFQYNSYLAKVFLYAFVGAIAIGFFWTFFNQFIGGTRASTEQISATLSASKETVVVNEEFTLNLLLSAPGGKKVSQLDLRVNLTPQGGGEVSYVANSYTSSRLGGTETDYFDTEIFEEYGNNRLRLVLSARKREADLSDKVLIKVKFKALKNGKMKYDLDRNNMEIAGPGAGEPISYSISSGSTVTTTVTIASGSVTPVPPTPTITLAPAPTCSNPQACGLEGEDGALVSMRLD